MPGPASALCKQILHHKTTTTPSQAVATHETPHTHGHWQTTNKHTDKQSYRHTDIQTYRHTDKQSYRHTDIQTYRHTDIQTYRHTDIQTYRHTDTPHNLSCHSCCHEPIPAFLLLGRPRRSLSSACPWLYYSYLATIASYVQTFTLEECKLHDDEVHVNERPLVQRMFYVRSMSVHALYLALSYGLSCSLSLTHTCCLSLSLSVYVCSSRWVFTYV